MPHTIYFQIGGIPVEVTSDLPISSSTFDRKFDSFRIDAPGEDMVTLRHHFPPTPQPNFTRTREVYRKAPWVIFEEDEHWVYGEIVPRKNAPPFNRLAVFNKTYTKAHFYHDAAMKAHFMNGGLTSLTLLPTDQILFSQLLAERNGCYLHSAGLILNGKGYVFAGHSGAGKSTITQILSKDGIVLCDDRTIVRRQAEGYYVYGTWSHGDIPDVSASAAPLAGIMFLHQAETNHIDAISSRREAVKRILPCLIKPFVTAGWWHRMLDVVEDMATHLPCYDLYFDKEGGAVKVIDALESGHGLQ